MTKKAPISLLWKRWHINAVVPEWQMKTSKPIGGLFLKESDVFHVFTCCILSHYYLDARLLLFIDWASQQHILFTVTKVLDEELIRILKKTSIGMLRHLYSLSHLLVGFMLYEFSLFILCGTSDVLLDLQMPPRAPSWNVNCCVMGMQHFLPCTVGQPRQISSRRLICFMIMVHYSGRQSFSPESLNWNWSSHAQVKLQTRSSLRNSLSHPTAHFQTSPAHFPISFLSRLSPTRINTHAHNIRTWCGFIIFVFLLASLPLFHLLSTFAMWGIYVRQ